MTEVFIQAFIYLAAAVIAVPIAKRLGLGSVLGYLIAGVVIGPLTGLIGQEAMRVQHFAEFGVVMMLFLVGLELEPEKLWAMRHRLFGLGGLQVAGTTAAITGVALALGQPLSYAFTIGLVFSLSSTAIVLQTFDEKNLQKTEGAQHSFSILLFQDIAVIPMLAFIPLLAVAELANHSHAAHHAEELSLVAGLPGWAYGSVIVAAIAAVVAGGHYLSRPLFRIIANTGLREIFTAAALLLVIGIAALMNLVGLSPALGTFLAGVVLANSEFRHELESTVAPFKGLLLGLFFITVGAGVNVSMLVDHFGTIIALTVGVIAIKMTVIYWVARGFRINGSDRWLVSLGLAQAGEFGFVLLGFTTQHNVLPAELTQTLSLVVALSMFLTPGLFILFEKVIQPRFVKKANEREPDTIDEPGQVIIAGMGRMGQIINRLLVANGVKTVMLDYDTTQVDMMRQIGTKAHYGDACNPQLLHTAGIENASAFIVAIDQQDNAVNLVSYVHQTYPDVTIVARAYDRGQGYRLRQAGADIIESETYHSSLELGMRTLKAVGHHPFYSEQQKAAYKKFEDATSDMLYEAWADDEAGDQYDSRFQQLFIRLEQEMHEVMGKDKRGIHSLTEREWTPPPKQYLSEFKED